MQSDYVSAFGIGGLITDGSGISNNTTSTNNGVLTKPTTTKPVVVSSDETSTEYRRTSPSRRNNQMYSKSSTMIASGPTTLRPLATADMLSETKRTRFNSVETPPTTTNTSSSSTDTVTPLHGLAAKAVSAAATATAAAATAVLRRSQSIKQAAQAKRKSALRSLSHTLPSSSPHHHHHHSMAGTNNNQNDNDQYELDDMRIKYESFCNRDDDDENDQDADVEDDDDDEPDENESLLHSSKQAAQIEPSIKDINNNLDSPNSSLLQTNLNTNNVDDSLKVVIVNSNGTIPGTTADKNNNVKVAAIKTAKRSDSVRMRHHSNISTINMGNNGGGGAESTSSSSRLKKYFKCRKNKVRSKASQRRHNYIVIFLLFVVNLLNYIDRYTLAGVLLDVQDYFGINDSESGLLQTVFICSYMLLAPLFGYMGDRYSRKWIIIFGITFWSLMTFLGSLVPADKFWLFALIRSLVGIGEASYSCVAPTIIGDLFTNEMRTKMLAVFYLAVPVGSGLGYIVGSNIAQIFNNWKWALRFTPPLGFICVLLLIFVVQEPKRGGAESGSNENDSGASKSNIKEDVIYLLKNKTFMWITFGFTFASFVLGGLSWWVPAYVQYAIYSNNKIPDQIPLKFGVVTCLSGLFGVALSSVLAEKLRKKTPNADPLVCALGSLIAVPSLFILILLTGAVNEVLFWMIAAVAISAMCLSWTIVADVLLYAIYPHRRSIASALNILICHLFGDAGSPYVIGAISDALRKGKPDTYNSKFTSLQVALYAGPFFAALSFAAYLFTAIYVVEDKKDVDDFIRRSKQMNEAINGSGEEGNDKNFTSSNESTLNEMSSSRSKKISEHTAYLNPVAFTQETGTTNELQSNPK